MKTELAAEGLQPEEWGGTTQFSEVSAKQKLNLDDLKKAAPGIERAVKNYRRMAQAKAA